MGLYFSNAFDQRCDVRLIGKKMWLHTWPMEWIFTLQADATAAIWTQQNRHHAKCRL